MNIEQLLRAAEYLDRREREAEHGYASSLPMPEEYDSRKTKTSPPSKKSLGTRTTHNELEKLRRAQLRQYLENLKDMVPVGSDSSRHTTLGLLTKAKAYIKALEEKDRKQSIIKNQLCQEHQRLKQRLQALKTAADRKFRAGRSYSECSSSTASTASSSSAFDEHDEVDVINSDSDEMSCEGYGGMVVTTSQFSLTESL